MKDPTPFGADAEILVKPDDVGWFNEEEQFLVDCPQCAQYTMTLTPGMAEPFCCLLAPDELRMVERLSRYLHKAGDDVDREVTEE